VPPESARKMPRKAQVRDHAVANYQPLHHGDFKVRHRGEETLGRVCRPTRPLGAAGRQSVIDEVGPDRTGEQNSAAVDPEPMGRDILS
jgi:hypothetical protein